eukprot:5897486-Lingulodinium_polyedra.AAC.1
MREFGFGGDFEQRAPSRAVPDGWAPFDRPCHEVFRVLRAAWDEREWRAVASRRRGVPHLSAGID